ncbi:hypothetical protein DFQ28_001674 [Apophysomyces sp. BC1034]|nr:hypothetical protein DFQ30_002087 [Apophysomyces sp. BC1015]KAG0179559.1 hypothetical protein DFQ29_001939 [Apophysomyces sp. BC1021]KAG0190706.1 hypothetical protein DFQ28_001674 [Apophysomyces sp. BC1034]
MSGANLLNVASNSMVLGLFTDQAAILADSLDRFYNAVRIIDGEGDGVRPDGSFMQHNEQLYTGNYGKDYINSLIHVFVQTRGTELSPPINVQNVFQVLMDGTQWMVISNSPNHTILWEYSTIGRMISFAAHDMQASDGVAINLTQIEEGTISWDNATFYKQLVHRLTAQGMKRANQGPLIGTRYFFNSDYMVHRGNGFVVTLKMFSKRTTNAECINNQDPLGFHLSDGAIYTYVRGDEYVDVFGAWDWNLVPGTTVDYGGTPLICKKTKWRGKEAFVGGVTHENFGIAVMNYTNPYTHALKWRKTVVFLPEAYVVQMDHIQSENSSAPVRTTLDQCQLHTPIYLDGQKLKYDLTTKSATQLWHGNVGYYFPNQVDVIVDSQPRKSNWSQIGISKNGGSETLFTAAIQQNNTKSTSYIAYPNVGSNDFPPKASPEIKLIEASEDIRGVYYTYRDRVALSLAFWTSGKYTAPDFSVETNRAIVLLLMQASGKWTLTVADPSQTLSSVRVRIESSPKPVKTFDIKLPKGGLAGSRVEKQFHI